MKKGMMIFLMIVVVGMYLFDLRSVLQTRQTEASTTVRPEEMEDYDPEVGIKAFGEGDLPDGIDYEMSFLQYDNQYGTTEPIGGLVHEVDDDGYEYYEVVVCVKNNTSEALSGMKLFLELPVSIGERSVVGDAMTLTARLEYEGAVARKALNLVGNNSPIEVVFPGGSAGFIKRGDSEIMKLPAYEDDVLVPLFDYWQNEGFELNIPAGEKWVLTVGINAHAVANFEVQSRIASMNDKHSGKELYSSIIFKREKQFHVVTDITNLTDMDQPVELWLNFDSEVDLVPGSVRLNGRQVDDFILQEETGGYKDFKTTDLGVNASHKTLTLEYDVKMKVGGKSDGASFVRDSVRVGTTSVGVTVGSYVCDVTVMFVLLSLVHMAAIFAVVYSFIRTTRRNSRKGAE